MFFAREALVLGMAVAAWEEFAAERESSFAEQVVPELLEPASMAPAPK
jgi:hypothetical protein